MKFTLLRRLTHSELGMFHAYRKSGREGSRQRAINFDSDVVDRVFPSASDAHSILITCRSLAGAASVVVKDQWLKKQEKNWRLEGYCPESPLYRFVRPGVLFAMVVDASQTPARASWVVIPKRHRASTAILNHGETSQLARPRSGMIALYGEEGDFCRRVLARDFPQLFEGSESMKSIATADNDPDEIPPDPIGTITILARAGHSLRSAVADLIDNSLSKGAHEIDITFPNPNQGGRWMCIRDDGEGMTPKGLREAMKIGHRRDYEASDLGKYGYGLKGAAFSQADRLTVVSKTVDSSQSVLTWDKAHLARTGRWTPLSDPVEKPYTDVTRLQSSGTAVLLTQMRPPPPGGRSRGVDPYALEVAAIRNHLELVFHRFLEGSVPGRGKVTIRLHTSTGVTALRPNNPMGHPLTEYFDPKTIEIQGHETASQRPKLRVQAFITPNEAEFTRHHQAETPEQIRDAQDRLSLNGRANEAQGFYFYRLHRLIQWGGWQELFAKDEHTKLLRVAVDFDRLADEALQVDISKQIIRLPVAVTEHFKSLLKGPRSAARERYANKDKSGNGGVGPKNGSGAGSTGTTTGGDTPPRGKKGSTATSPGATAAAKKSPLRLVEGVRRPWERKIGFKGEVVEISERIPELVTLVETIEGNNDAKAALSEFLRVLEQAGIVTTLAGEPDGK